MSSSDLIGFVAWIQEELRTDRGLRRQTIYQDKIMPQKHRVRNWGPYNTALKKRGDLFLYFDDDLLNNGWHFKGPQKAGGRRIYSDKLIEMMLSIKYALRLPLRQAQGFVESCLKRLGYNLAVPDYSTISRRAKNLSLKVKCLNKFNRKEALHLLIDSTGLSVYSGSYFHLSKHQRDRKSRRSKAWKKLHIAFDIASSQVVSAYVSESNVQDASAVEHLTKDIASTIGSIRADRAYDKKRCYRIAYERGAQVIIPPYRNARLQKENRKPYEDALKARDDCISFIRMYPSYDEGVKEWKKQSAYHKRSRVEALMHRYKRAFGFSIVAKNPETIKAEVITRINILNLQSTLGRAISEPAI